MCQSSAKLATVQKTARIIVDDAPACDESMTRIQLLIDLPFTHQVKVHRSCLCNELVALRNRHLVDRGIKEYSPPYIYETTKFLLNKLDSKMGTVEPISLTEVCKSYKGSKKRMYFRAKLDYEQGGFNLKYSKIKMFVKPDKYDAVKVETKAPRAIQYRHPIFNLLLARFLKPIEHKLYSILDGDGCRFSAKGLNVPQRAAELVKQASFFDDPVFLLLDHKTFDSSVTVEHLKLMAKHYRKWSPSKILAWLLSMQLNNKGITKNGIRYSIKGTKMSGDFNTALDNTFLNYLCLSSWLNKNKVYGKLLVDGDDSVLTIEHSSLNRLMADFIHFRKFGFETECEIVHQLSEVEFCRSKLLPTEKHPTLAREPIRALSNLCVSLKQYSGKARSKYLAGNALCELHRSVGVPILYKTAEAIYNKFSKYGWEMDTETRYKFDMYKVENLFPPSLDHREAYQDAYDISINDQILIEQEIQDFIKAGLIDYCFQDDKPESAAEARELL